jgi:hypothetical protein
MSANELLEQVKSLPARERRRFFEGVHAMEERLAAPPPANGRRSVRWPDAEARRRRILGNRMVPNLVLLVREEERY